MLTIHTTCNTTSYLLSNWPISYPSGYEGYPIQLSSPGSTVTGNIQCANSQNIISAVQINVQVGDDGNAVITDDGMGGKNYYFHLWQDSSYSIIAICDGDPFYGPTVDINLYSTYNWICATTGDQNVCAAS